MSRERNFDDDEPEYSQSSSKRSRTVNHVVEEEEEEEEVTLLVGNDGFVQGSIVKITLTNFVTYDYCEIMPGPQMNMIIGPNGTGKSTIVCAIALGLGGSPALLGRAKNIAEFVKTGADEATISIELKMVETRNVVIQRTFKKVDNTNTWRKNGRTTSLKDILTTVRDLNIQVDNLCQFLPQDRVSEFAELSPSQLLERTQAAAGESDLHDMQKKLMEWREKEKIFEKAQHSDLDHLKTLQIHNAESERDVLRMQQRTDILNNISLLEAQIPLIKYSEAKADVDKIKDQVNQEKELVQKVKTELAPTQSLIKECETEARKVAKKFTDENFKFKEQDRRVKSISTEIQAARESIKATKASIASTKERIPTEQRKIENIKAQIQKLEDAVRDPPSTDYSQFEDAITELNRETSDLHNESITLNQRLRETGSKKHGLENALKDKKRE
ncbi:P-loop containing nucleoside triphosphate hydrolase protein [Thamnidium elegans]|nr:P-loop containing nucleoside triphosphate hydrolase protein [Thamnidium elegans]